MEGEAHHAHVHWSPPGHSTAEPPPQLPPLQLSSSVQGSPSSQLAVLLAWVQPVAVLQPSVVQTLLSLQSTAEPPQVPEVSQTSSSVQAFPSLQVLPSRMLVLQVAVPLQLCSMHWVDVQVMAVPAQAPPLQVSA